MSQEVERLMTVVIIFFTLQLGFNLLLISMALFNALQRPHKRYADIIESLHADGARLYLAVSALRLITLILSIVGSPFDCLGFLDIVWALDSIVTSQIYMRVEGLRFATLKGKSFLVT